MIKFYYHPSPNPAKVALFFEESSLPYELVPVDTRKGEQHSPEFLAINPNAKTPAICDGDIRVFDSTAILYYLAEKTGLFLPDNQPGLRAKMHSWMQFVATGVGPYTGQYVHFKLIAPDNAYARNRYDFEAWRHWRIIDTHLSTHHYMLGDTYSIVDMNLWGWARSVTFALGEAALDELPNLKRFLDEINGRPAALRVAELKDRFAFKQEIDAETMKALFPQNERLQRA